MSLYDYETGKRMWKDDEPFYGIIMGAMLRADTANGEKLRREWPGVHAELQARYDAPGGRLSTDPDA